MSPRRLAALNAGPGTSAAWAVGLASAIDGSGPALLPLPAGPSPMREALVAALRPEDPGAALESDDVALVVPTSGSTGEPKGAMLSASALIGSAAATHARLGGAGRWVLALPLTHIAGLMVVVRAIGAGAPAFEVDQSDGFDIARFAATTAVAARGAAADGLPLYTSLVPTQLLRLLDADPSAGVDLTAYAGILVGAAATPASLLERAARAGARVVTTYGMSETCGGCVYDGQALDGVVVQLDRADRIVLGGPTLFSGYRLRPDLTAAALDTHGRLVTADRGALDRDGRLWVLGRADDVIISGGENVAPAAVEGALAAVPGIGAAVVVGVPDPQWGEQVVAVVVPRDGATVLLADVRAALAAQLPPAAVPRDLVVVEAIPVLGSGKPDRSAARDLAVARHSARQGAHPSPTPASAAPAGTAAATTATTAEES